MKNKIKTTYYCYCGCVYYDREDLITNAIIIGGRRSIKMRCPKHKQTSDGDIKEKSRICECCGKKVFMEPRGVKKMHPECAEDKRAAANRARSPAKKVIKKALFSAKDVKTRNIRSAKTIHEAKRKGVACIPLQSLFAFNKKMQDNIPKPWVIQKKM